MGNCVSVQFECLSVCCRTRADPRGIIEYRDLDAPEDIDMI